MRYKNNEQVLVEKYRPRTIDDCILPEQTKRMFKGYVETGKFPNLLLSGTPGIGKTTVAKALCNELGYETKFVNGSDEGRLIDTLRTEISSFSRNMSMDGSRKCVILDESDYLPADTVQPALRNFSESNSFNCSFIMTCNFPNRIIDPLKSRFSHVAFDVAPEDKRDIAMQMYKRLVYILESESIEFDKAVLGELIKTRFPDMRKIINEIDHYRVLGKIDAGILKSRSDSRIDELVDHLSKKNFKECRNWLATSTSLEIAPIVRKIYDRMSVLVTKESIPFVVIILAQYQYKHSFAVDSEINIMAMLTELMISEDIEFKD